MKSFVYSLVAAFCVIATFAYADYASLPNKKPAGADQFLFVSSGNLYGTNWQNMEQFVVQGVNWTAMQIAGSTVNSAGVNWTLPNAYIGG